MVVRNAKVSINDQRSKTNNAEENLLQLLETNQQLYIHEDNLCWTKLKNELYICIALMGGAGYLFLEPPDAEKYWMILILSAVGIVANVMFWFMLHSGAKHLLARKKNCGDILKVLGEKQEPDSPEEKLYTSIHNYSEKNYMQRRLENKGTGDKAWKKQLTMTSATTKILNVVPIVCGGLFFVLALYTGKLVFF